MQALVRLPDGTGQTLKVEGMKDACRQAWRIGAKSLVCMDEETWTFIRSDLLGMIGLGRPGLFSSYSDKWQPPTLGEYKELLRLIDLPSSHGSNIVGIDPSEMRKWSLMEGKVPYWAWRLLSIYAGIVIPDSLPGLEYRPALSL